MTICEKLNFMIRCFEDINLAITEMGGIISGGYSSYPNGIRSIYQENIDFGNISEYPSYGTTEQKTAFCLEIKEQIRQAIAEGGIDIPNHTPFDDYADKIRLVESKELNIVTSKLPEAERDVPYLVSLEISGGKPPYTVTISESSRNQLPSYFTLSKNGTISGMADTSAKAATYRIKFQAADSNGNITEKELRLPVKEQSVNFKLLNPYVVYDGEPHKPIIKPVDLSPELIEDIDYRVTLGSDNVSEITNIQLCRVNIIMLNKRYRQSSVSPSMFGIVRATPVINAESFSVSYDGLPHEAVYTITPAKLVHTVTYINQKTNSSTTEPPIEAGTYRVVIATNDKNCIDTTATCTITII
jgi:hypothetical protein